MLFLNKFTFLYSKDLLCVAWKMVNSVVPPICRSMLRGNKSVKNPTEKQPKIILPDTKN